MNKNNIIVIVVILLVGIIGAWYVISDSDSSNNQNINPVNSDISGPQGDEVVIVVNGQEITGTEFQELKNQILIQQGIDPNTLNEQTNSQLQQQIIDTLVAQTLLKQQSQELAITVTEEQINQQLDAIKKQFPTPEEFQSALDTQGITEEELIETISSELVTQNYLEQEIDTSILTATQEEVETAYQEIIDAGQEVPSLEEIYSQIEQMVVQQKQQQLVEELVEELRTAAEIEILI